MDALTKAAIDSLIKKMLPGLSEELAKLRTLQNYKDASSNLSQEGWYLLNECRELLTLVSNNLSQSVDKADSSNIQENIAEDHEISDEEAMRLMAEMDEAQTPQPATNTATQAESEEMSDDEAQRLLAMMEDDEPLQATDISEKEPAPQAQDQSDQEESFESDEDLVEIEEWEANDFQTDPDMINDFIVNADEIMAALDSAILQLEQDPGNREIIEEIFRGAHTLKGAAGMFGFKGLERVMHRMENLFDLIRKNKLNPSPEIVDVVFQGLDLLRELLQAVKNGKPCGARTVPVVLALQQAARGEAVAISSEAKAESNTEAPSGQEADKDSSSGSTEAAQSISQKKEQSTIRVDLERLDVLVNLIGELVIDRTRFASIEEELRTNYPQIELASSISETVQLFGRHMNEIQDIIMKVRMVPIGNTFNKFTRIVRDMARSLNKKIELQISGANSELDKTMVEQIGDPLIHLIRNSCDHGIEYPEERIQAGKSPTGKIQLSAHQEGNHIVITIRDDGKGMNPEYIRRKGIERGLITEDEVLSDRDIFNLIFEPGFSTAEKVTNISGRGVGMDVVKKQIMKLKGMIEINSAPGQGTLISIRLPLTLAIVQSLLVRSKAETFAIPLSTVIESIRVHPSEIQKVGETEVYKLRDKVLPLIHLDEALGLHTKKGSMAEMLQKATPISAYQERRNKRQERVFIVVVGHGDRPTGIVVDQLLNQQEMVIKPMGSLMKNIPCVAGGAVLGHGEVVLVLDIPELEELAKSRSRSLTSVA